MRAIPIKYFLIRAEFDSKMRKEKIRCVNSSCSMLNICINASSTTITINNSALYPLMIQDKSLKGFFSWVIWPPNVCHPACCGQLTIKCITSSACDFVISAYSQCIIELVLCSGTFKFNNKTDLQWEYRVLHIHQGLWLCSINRLLLITMQQDL